jgi:hypothetical protein
MLALRGSVNSVTSQALEVHQRLHVGRTNMLLDLGKHGVTKTGLTNVQTVCCSLKLSMGTTTVSFSVML